MSELWRRLRVLLRRERFDSDLEEEMQAHVEMQAEENEANGIEPEEARYAARRQFGNATLLKERSRDTWGWASVERLSQDLRYGVRILSRNPAFTAVAVLCLALGTGANTAIFSLMDALLLRDLPIREPERLVVFGDDLAYSYQAFEGFRDANQWFSGILATSGGRPIDINIEGKEQEPVKVELISGSYFPVLGVDAVLGRTIMPDDDRLPGAGPMVVLSHAFWVRRFHRDPEAVGKRIAINRRPFTVIGVAAAGFCGLAVDSASDVWVPITMQRHVIPGEDWLTRRPGSERGSLRVFARLKPGVARQAAEPPMNGLWVRQQTETFGGSRWLNRRLQERPLRLMPAGRGVSYLRRTYTRPLEILTVTTGLLLLVTCVNLATLLLARAGRRLPEVGVRLSLGASRGRLIRQMLTEAVVLSSCGGVLGLFIAQSGVRILLRMLSGGLESLPLRVGLNWRVIGFTVVVTLATTLLFGLWPALQATGIDVSSSIKQGRRGGRRNRFRAARFLTLVQVSLSVLLLVGTGLFVRTLWNLRRIDLGLNPERLIQFHVDVRGAGYQGEAYWRFCRELQESIATLPGITAVTLSGNGLFTPSDRSTNFDVPGITQQPEDTTVNYEIAGPGYFTTLGIRIVAGRDFGPQDSETATRVVILNDALARFYFQSGSPIGRKVRVHGADWEIIGVVSDVRDSELRRPPRRFFYLPFFQAKRDLHFSRLARFLIRTSADEKAVIGLLPRAVRVEHPALPIIGLNSVPALIDRQIAVERMMATLSGYFGFIAILLIAAGVYGVLSYDIVHRTREIGIRIAVGAPRRTVLWEISRESIGFVIAGLVVGVGAASVLSRLVASLLFEVKAEDTVTFAVVSAILIAVALIAVYVPARRATKIDPMEALRYE